MKTFKHTSLEYFSAWSGAIETQEAILAANKGEEFDNLIEEQYPDGLSETQLNDILWFEEDWLFEMLGIDQDEEE